MRNRIALVFFLLTWMPLARATTLLPMNLDDLTAVSQTVVYAKVVASRVEWNADRTLIFTIYTVEPIEYLKGPLGPSFELREPGGELDGLSVTVPAVPTFAVGEETVLFVWTDPQGRRQVTGFEQGSLRVEREPQTGTKFVSRSIPLGSARTSTAGLRPPATSRSLPQLFEQIRTSVAKTRAAAATE